MPLNKILWRNILLGLFVSVFSLGLLAPQAAFVLPWPVWQQAVAHGLLIGQFYYWLHERPKPTLQLLLLTLSGLYYLFLYQELWIYLFFWLFLLLLLLLALSYDHYLKWRRIPYLKSFLIPVLWFLFLNVIPSMAANNGRLNPVFLLFYFALSLQADREDLTQDQGNFKTLAGLLGNKNTGYLVLFLLALCAYLFFLPFVWVMIPLVVMNREQFFPKRSFDSLLFLLGLYFLFR
jgi:hypothetical protein